MAKYVKLRQNEEQRQTTQEVTLDGVRFRLRAQYVALTDRWYVSVLDTTDALIVGPIACVPGVDLLHPYKHLAIPQGQLFCSSADREPPTFSTLDATARVLYRPEADV